MIEEIPDEVDIEVCVTLQDVVEEQEKAAKAAKEAAKTAESSAQVEQ